MASTDERPHAVPALGGPALERSDQWIVRPTGIEATAQGVCLRRGDGLDERSDLRLANGTAREVILLGLERPVDGLDHGSFERFGQIHARDSQVVAGRRVE